MNEQNKIHLFTFSKRTMSFFQSYNKQTAILLVDASGSTGNQFHQNRTIFDVIAKVCSQLDHPNFRVLFWNSLGTGDEKFPNGAHIIPFVVKPENLATTFKMVQSFMKPAATHTHLAFTNLPADWLQSSPMVYLITDGEICAGGSKAGITEAKIKEELARQINKLESRLSIVTVEAKVVDHSQEEVLHAAGSDVFQVIQDAKLTKKVTQFVSYTKPAENKGDPVRFVHINRNDPPPGFVPYEQRYFREVHMPDFYHYIHNELKESKDNEAKQLQIAQNLANTLSYITKDKPERLVNEIVANFAQLFTLDSTVIHHMLTEAIAREREGRAGVFATFRKNLKDLYKEAGLLLSKNVKRAIGLSDMFVSCPIHSKILVGPVHLVNISLRVKNGIYPKSSYERVPVLPLDTINRNRSELQEQCVRQWIRVVYGFIHNVNQASDELIYLFLADMLIVNRSATIPDNVKLAYINLGRAMLRKKRMNSMQTESERLETGELPIPNSGKINDFFLIMSNVQTKLKIKNTKPMRLWYEICDVLGGKIKEKQQPLCRELKEEWSETIDLPVYTTDIIPDELNLDYSCLVTLEDISKVGGWRINKHTRRNLPDCHPVYLFSDVGKTQLLASNHCMCPVCYTPIGADQFTKVGPRMEFKLDPAFQATPFIRPDGKWQKTENKDEKEEDALSDVKHVLSDVKQKQPVKTNSFPGKLVVMKGVVGCGKTTLAEEIKQRVEARGGTCFVEGVDKYINQGFDFKTAPEQVTQALETALEFVWPDKVVVIDTCGDHNNNKRFMKFFGVDFSGWQRIDLTPNFTKTDVPGYLAWSLWNVLSRKRNTATSNYLLNPETATVLTCVTVHKKKAQNLGWQKHWNFEYVRDAKDVETQAKQYRVPTNDISHI